MERLLQKVEDLRVHQVELESQNEELRMAQMLLEASRRRYADLYDSAPVGYFSFDDKCLIKDVNLTGARLLRRDKSSLLSKPFLLFIDPRDRRIFEEHVRAVFSTRARQSSELRLLAEDGLSFQALLESVTDENGLPAAKIIRSAVTDISARKKAEEALRRSEDEFRAMFTSAGVAIAQADPATGRLLRVNPTWTKLLGYSEPELRDITFYALTHPDDREADREGFSRLLRGEVEVYENEKRLLRKDGLSIWVSVAVNLLHDAAGEPVRTLAIITDISDRKRTEEALRFSETVAMDRLLELQAIYETAPVGLCVLDTDLRFLRVNSRMAEMNGVPPEEHIGRTVREVLPDLHKDAETAFQRIMETGRPLLDLELEGETPAMPGVRRAWLEQWLPLRNAEGKIIGVNIVAEEVTERKRTVQEIARLNASLQVRVLELQTANRDLEAFLYSVSHDLREPLRSIASFSGLLSHQYAALFDEKASNYLGRVTAGAARMNGIIEDLLGLFRISRQELRLQTLDMSSMAGTILNDLQHRDFDRLVAADIQSEVTAVADRGLLEIALSNLLRNAWKFTSRTGNARIEFGAVESSGKTIYYIRDNGAGFDPELSEKLFQPFQRLHSDGEYEGTGIGLAIVERIVRRHGGSIWAEGKRNNGAAFYFTLN